MSSTIDSGSQTPTLRERLSEKKTLIFSAISAVNNSKDKRAAVNGVVADFRDHVRSKSLEGLSSLPGMKTATWVTSSLTSSKSNSPSKKQSTNDTEKVTPRSSLSMQRMSQTEPSSTSGSPRKTTIFEIPNSSALQDFEEAQFSKESSDEENDSCKKFSPSTGNYSSDDIFGSFEPEEQNKSTAFDSKSFSSSKVSPKKSPLMPQQEYILPSTASSSSSTKLRDSTADGPQQIYTQWNRDLDQAYKILLRGLSQFSGDSQLDRSIAVHGLGRLINITLSELQYPSSTIPTNTTDNSEPKLTAEEQKQLINLVLTPLMQGRMFTLDIAQQDNTKGNVNSSKPENAEPYQGNLVSNIMDSPNFYDSVNRDLNTQRSNSPNSSFDRQDRVIDTSPPIYEPQNFAERLVVSSVRSSCLAIKAAAPYIQQLFQTLAIHERKHKLREKVGSWLLNVIRFILAITVSWGYKFMASKHGARVGRLIQGMMIAFISGCSQAAVILATTGIGIDAEANKAWGNNNNNQYYNQNQSERSNIRLNQNDMGNFEMDTTFSYNLKQSESDIGKFTDTDYSSAFGITNNSTNKSEETPDNWGNTLKSMTANAASWTIEQIDILRKSKMQQQIKQKKQ